MLLDKKLIFVLCLTMLVSLHVFSQSENNNSRQKPRRPAMKLLEQKKNKLNSLATFKRNERIRLENENANLEKEIEQQKQLYTTELSQADNELHKQKENINRMSAEASAYATHIERTKNAGRFACVCFANRFAFNKRTNS